MNVDNTDSVATLEKLRRLPADRRRVLFTGGTVVTMDPGLGVIDNGDVLIEGDTITAVGRGRAAHDP
ncbi:amidohydrolase family protein, partial [Streptomyces niveus]